MRISWGLIHFIVSLESSWPVLLLFAIIPLFCLPSAFASSSEKSSKLDVSSMDFTLGSIGAFSVLWEWRRFRLIHSDLQRSTYAQAYYYIHICKPDLIPSNAVEKRVRLDLRDSARAQTVASVTAKTADEILFIAKAERENERSWVSWERWVSKWVSDRRRQEMDWENQALLRVGGAPSHKFLSSPTVYRYEWRMQHVCQDMCLKSHHPPQPPQKGLLREGRPASLSNSSPR